MKQRAEDGFSTATELADLLVKRANLPFRDAHAVVGKLISTIEGKSFKDVGPDDLKKAAKEVLGKEVVLDANELNAALDPSECVKVRVLPGGPAPKAVQAQANEIKHQIKSYEKLLNVRKRMLQKSDAKLLKEAKGRAK